MIKYGTMSCEPRHSRPELICKKRNRRFEMELDVSDCNVTDVRQNGESLPIKSDTCELSDYSGYLEVTYKHGKTEEITLFNGHNPLIFKLSKNWQRIGRNMKGVTAGYFLVFAPLKWRRDGEAPHMPASCGDETFLAHHIVRLDAQEALPTLYEGSNPHQIAEKNPINLSGECFFDDSPHGQLFIGDTPELEFPPDITWVRVGEERQRGWKGENFEILDATFELEEALKDRQGRFYVRIYDENVDLLDSRDFRYLSNLRKILIDDMPYVPDMSPFNPCPKKGYSPTKMQFFGADNTPPDIKVNDKKHLATEPSEGVVVFNPHPDADKVTCSVLFDKSWVSVTVNIPRIWWRLENGRKHSNWRSIPYQMTLQKFYKYAEDGTAIRLRLPAHIERVKIGFDPNLERTRSTSRPPKYGFATLRLDMDDFTDDKHLGIGASLNIQCGEGEFIIPIVQISSNLTFLASKQLYAYVRRRGSGFRKGRGFSKTEIEAVGFNCDDVRPFIPVDTRRHGGHQRNIDALEEDYFDA